MKKEIIIVPRYEGPLFTWLAMAPHYGLKELGVPSTVSVVNLDSFQDQDNKIIIAIGQEFTPFKRNPSNTYIAWDPEQVPYYGMTSPLLEKRSKYVAGIISNFDYYYVTHPKQVEHLESLGFTNGRYASMGFQDELDLGLPEETKKNVDVLFYGSSTRRRLDALQKLRNAGITVADTKLKAYPEKIAACKKAKICLNIHGCDAPFFEKLRVYEWMSNNCFVISEHIEYPEVLIPGVHYIDCAYEDITKTVLEWIPKEAERNDIIKNARKIIEKDHYKYSMHKILTEIGYYDSSI